MDRREIHAEESALLITVKGRVQGVGFRPFLFRLAEQYQITGTVQNNMDGIRMEAQGSRDNLERLIAAIQTEAPRLSRVQFIEAEPIAVAADRERFSIIPSSRAGASSLVIPVDSAVCEDCLREMRDPADPRYRYPFITCTQCGPRFSIIRELPYDRPYTSMDAFPLCERCHKEYNDVRDRRHHAQPVACPDCGPTLRLYAVGASAALQDGEQTDMRATGDEAVRECARLLREGAIVAIKGLGGYHLACDATDEAAVARLRQRKRRPTRPLAVMAADLGHASRVGKPTDAEKRVLASPEAPIVIVRKRDDGPLAEGVAPGMSTVGLMLPYTPLHHLLLEEAPLLVMTSANPSGQPILYKDDEAYSYMQGIADYILSHNREIVHPLDDSVVQLRGDTVDILRRSRGYVPDPILTDAAVDGIAAFGGQQKNTFALGRQGQIFIGPHIGDMEAVEVQQHWQREYGHLARTIGVSPQLAAVDLHPAYETGRIADSSGMETVRIQHHHAHLVACAADNGLPPTQEVYGMILDGTGYGPDGCAWGFEVLRGHAAAYQRLGHLRYTPLPGGEAAIRQPWRNAAGMLLSLFPEEGGAWAAELFPDKQRELAVLARMVEKRINTPMAGTCGRLFDAVSAILGLVMEAGYDGEPAIRLSELAAYGPDEEVDPYTFIIHPAGACLELDLSPALCGIVAGRLSGRPPLELALRFHETVAQAAVRLLLQSMEAERKPRLSQVVLSGGSFHNRWLASRVSKLLADRGLQVLTHQQVPCGDGGLALGQLIAAAAMPMAAKQP